MNLACVRQRGITLLELVIACSLSSLLSLVLMNLYATSISMSVAQRDAVGTLDHRVQLHHLLSHAIRDALVFDPSSASSAVSATQCRGLWIVNRCMPPVMVWAAGTTGPVNSPPALAGSQILLVRQRCCAGVEADLYYVAMRGGARGQQSALFRRRMLSDGRFESADEMIPGIKSLTMHLLGAQVGSSGAIDQLELSGAVDINTQWKTLALRVKTVFAPANASLVDDAPLVFTVSARLGVRQGIADTLASVAGP